MLHSWVISFAQILLHICCILHPVMLKGGKVLYFIFSTWKYLYWKMEKKKNVYSKYTAVEFLDKKKKQCYSHRGLGGNTDLRS